MTASGDTPLREKQKTAGKCKAKTHKQELLMSCGYEGEMSAYGLLLVGSRLEL